MRCSKDRCGGCGGSGCQNLLVRDSFSASVILSHVQPSVSRTLTKPSGAARFPPPRPRSRTVRVPLHVAEAPQPRGSRPIPIGVAAMLPASWKRLFNRQPSRAPRAAGAAPAAANPPPGHRGWERLDDRIALASAWPTWTIAGPARWQVTDLDARSGGRPVFSASTPSRTSRAGINAALADTGTRWSSTAAPTAGQSTSIRHWPRSRSRRIPGSPRRRR